MYMSQVQEGKSFLHQGQICLMELIEGVLQDKTQYRLFPEVSLARIVQKNGLEASLHYELQRFIKSCSSLDILICRHEAMFSLPVIAIERQSPYHDFPDRQEADRKKAAILRIGLWKKLKQKMDKRAIQQALNIGHEKWKHS